MKISLKSLDIPWFLIFCNWYMKISLQSLENLSLDRKADLLNKALLSIFRNYIPNKKRLNSTIVNLHGRMKIQKDVWKRDLN